VLTYEQGNTFLFIKNHTMKTQTRTTNPFAKAITAAIVIALALFVITDITKAQTVAGRIAFGIDAGGNKYYGNYTDNQFAFHGDAFIRWNILDELSLHAAYNGGQLKYKATAGSIANSGGGPIGSINHTRVGGWDLMVSYNVFPEQTFVPYFIAGIEALNFEPKDVNDVSLKNNANAVYSKNVLGGALGVGFEMYISDKITFNGKGLLHLTGTDWIDDYSDATNVRQDAFITMGLGFSYYIFAPAIASKPEREHENANVTNVTNNYTTNITRYDTVIVRETDTVYKEKASLNAIYNFPGTLFIVNTDEFNTSVPGNIQNLRNIKKLVQQCPELKVEIQGHASDEGTISRNQELSEMRARKIKSWLVGEGVSSSKVTATVGFGTSDNAVREPTNSSAATLEAARVQNRRIAVKVVETCN
jgi:outer membrane protein OmpA-like peptidoglycan-associated protein